MDPQQIGRHYDELVRRYGHNPAACDYGRPESQHSKFEVLSSIMPLAGRTVLDVGCGFADYADFLDQHHTGVEYSGIDVSHEMIKQARRLHPRIDIRQASIADMHAGRFDVVTANGIFYLLGADAWSTMKDYIARMYALCTMGVAFNSLSSWAGDAEPDEFHADPIETLAYCRTLTPWVALRHDYHSRDFTIFMYRSATASRRLSER